MSLISSFILNSHLIHKMDSNKLSLPVKHHIWEFICLGKNWGFVGFFCHDQHWEPQLTDKCVSSECTGEVLMKTQNALWLVTASSCVCLHVNMDVYFAPHVSAGSWSRLAAFRPEQGVGFIQLPPHYLSSPSVPVPFSLFGFEEKRHLWGKVSSQLRVHVLD